MKKPYGRFLVAAILTGLLIGSSLLLPSGELRLLRLWGVFFALLAIAFFTTPFFLLRKHGQIREGKTFLDTQVVVDAGLYSIVRHPQYLGYIFLVISFMLRAQYWLTTFFGTGALLFFYLHILQEEAYCLAKFGDQYRAYMQRVPRLNMIVGTAHWLNERRKRKHP